MIMFEQQRRLSEPLRWGRREKAAVGTLLAVAVLAVAGLGAYALTSGAPARRDCVDVTFASTLAAAPPATKFRSIAAVTSAGYADTPCSATGWSEAKRIAAAGREDGVAVRCSPANWTGISSRSPRLPRGLVRRC